MNIFLIGATGYVGRHVSKRLQERGHRLRGLTRRPEAARELEERGIEPLVGSIEDAGLILRQAREADCVIYAAVEFTPEGFEQEFQAIRTLLGAMKGSGKTLVYTSGAGVLGNSRHTLDEDSPCRPWPLVARRVDTERAVLEANAPDLRAYVVRPGMIYGGSGGAGLNLYLQGARDLGLAPYLDEGESVWPSIHVDDLAELYGLLIERSVQGRLVHAVDPHSVTMKAIAEAASEALRLHGGPTSVDATQLAEMYGAISEILSVDQRFATPRVFAELGWAPRRGPILKAVHGFASEGPMPGAP